MSWRDDLLPASFRGVTFFYEDTEGEGGRRVVNHEFPYRDDAYVEDLGKRNRKYIIAAYVLGDDYFSDRDALIAALEAEGAATLSHPYLGPLTVNVESFRWSELRDEGRRAKFNITFLDAGDNPSPVASLDTASCAFDTATDQGDTLALSFADGWDVTLGGVLAAAQLLLDLLEDALAVLVGWPGVDTAKLAPLIVDLQAQAKDAGALAALLLEFFRAYVGAVAETNVAFDEHYSSRGPLPIADPSWGLAALCVWGGTLNAATGPRRAANQAALVALVEGIAVTALAQLYARAPFQAQDDADAARTLITGLIDALAEAASDAGDVEGYYAWLNLYRAVTDDLTARALQLPATIDVVLNASLPALPLAYRFYGDIRRAGELVARNAMPHPLFFTAQVQVLTS